MPALCTQATNDADTMAAITTTGIDSNKIREGSNELRLLGITSTKRAGAARLLQDAFHWAKIAPFPILRASAHRNKRGSDSRDTMRVHAKDPVVESRALALQADKRGHRWAPLAAATIAMTPFLGVLLGGAEFYFDDHFRFSAPVAGLFAESVRAGHLPLWNPWVQTGTPLVAERGAMIAHPGLLLALVLPPSHAVGMLMVILLGVLAAGSTALLQALSVRTLLAMAVGAAIGLSGPALSYTSCAPFLATLAFWPLVLLATIRLARGKGSVVGAGMALGMALLGGDLPDALLAAVVALVVFSAAGGRVRTAWPRLLGVGAVALAVGAGSWFPVLWALPMSERGAGIAASEAGRWSFHPAEILGFVWPHPLGLPLPRFTFWPFRQLRGERLFLHSVWIGSLLATASLFAWRQRNERVARTLAAVALVLLVVATGAWTPLWPLLRPLFTYVRYPSKLAAPAALLLAFAGAITIERLLAHPRTMRNLCLLTTGLGAFGSLAGPRIQTGLASRFGTPPEIILAAATTLRTDTARTTLLAALGAGLYYLVERGRLSVAGSVPLLATLLFLDVFTTTVDLSWTRPTVTLSRPAFLPDVGPRGPRVMRLEEVTHARLALNDKAFSDEQLRQASLLMPLSNLVDHAGVLDPYGLYSSDVARAMADLAASNPLALAEIAAVDVVLAAPGSRAPWLAEAVDSHRLVPTYSLSAGAIALRVPHAFPRSFLTTNATLAPRSEIPGRLSLDVDHVLLSAESSLFAGRFVPIDLSAIPIQSLDGHSNEHLAVIPQTWRPGAATYRIVTATSALLVEMDAFIPGWRVFVDGREQPILQANVFGRAVVVPAGTHDVEWRFAPRLVMASLAMSWLGLAVGLLALVLRKRTD